MVTARLTASELTNCELRLAPITEFPSQITSFPESFFDVIVVDGNEIRATDRLDCLKAATKRVKPGGLIVFDDSDRRRYSGWRVIVDGWDVRRFVGVRAKPFMATETSILRRPLGAVEKTGTA